MADARAYRAAFLAEVTNANSENADASVRNLFHFGLFGHWLKDQMSDDEFVAAVRTA